MSSSKSVSSAPVGILGSQALTTQHHAKCLGYWRSWDLSASKAIDEAIQRARRAFFAFGAIGAFNGKLNPISSRTIFDVCVIPILLYARGSPLAGGEYEISKSSKKTKDFKISSKISDFRLGFRISPRDFWFHVVISDFVQRFQDFVISEGISMGFHNLAIDSISFEPSWGVRQIGFYVRTYAMSCRCKEF